MANIFRRMYDSVFPSLTRSSTFPLSAWVKYLHKYGFGSTYSVQGRDPNTEGVPNDYEYYARRFYKGNGVVFAVAQTRMRVFAQIEFKWRPKNSVNAEHSLLDASDGERYKELDLLDYPAPGLTATGLLAKAITDIDIAGNSYWIKERMPNGEFRLTRLRPDWVDIVLSAPPEEDANSEVIGYVYYPGGYGGPGRPVVYTVEEVAHWAPHPDPEAQYRGLSPLTSICRELLVEESANEHRLSFFKRGATPNFAVAFKERQTSDMLDDVEARLRASHSGVDNHYNPFVVAGADIIPIETDIAGLDMQNISGRAETHIANAFGVHPTVVGLMESMQGSSLNSGNYGVASRGFVNQTMHYMWHSFCESMERLIKPPKPTRRKNEKVRLWYSTANVAVLNDDRLERSQIRNQDAETIDKLVREGWEPESAKEYVKTGNIDKLVHSGRVSVQLYDPDADPTDGSESNLAPEGGGSDNAPSEKDPVPNVDPKAGSDSSSNDSEG